MAPNLSFQESHLLLQIPDDSISLLDDRPGILQLYFRENKHTQTNNVTCSRDGSLFQTRADGASVIHDKWVLFYHTFPLGSICSNQLPFMCLPPQNLISSLMASCAFLGTGEIICIVCECVCALCTARQQSCVRKYLLDHVADFPLLTL